MYDVALIEKYGSAGLTPQEMNELFASLSSQSAYPVSFDATEVESTAMGLISPNAANALGYETGENSELRYFVADILDDMDNENETGVYDFNGLSVYITR